MSIDTVMGTLQKYKCKRVEITGGEPLLQKQTVDLARELLNNQYQVLVETNGTMDIDMLPEGVVRIVDVKCKGSGESMNTDWENLNRLKAWDEVKFVLTSREDYEEAKMVIEKYNLNEKVPLLLSVADGYFPISNLAEWMLKDGLNVRLQLQLHRIIWPKEKRGR